MKATLLTIIFDEANYKTNQKVKLLNVRFVCSDSMKTLIIFK